MSAARQRGHADARGLYEAVRGRYPAWPPWADLRLRTRDLWAATLRATGYDRDKAPKTAGNGAAAAHSGSGGESRPRCPDAAPGAVGRGRSADRRSAID